jgi:ABC-type multidrug transport system ATPase subunit
MCSDAVIRFWNVEKRYGRRVALAIDDFSISSGERLLLLGPNGSGKSTLLRLLDGISRPTKGRIDRAMPERIRIGFVPQAGGLYGDMSLRQNLAIFHRFFGNYGARPIVRRTFIEDAGLGRVMDVPLAELSGGLQKLATLACMFTSAPDALLLDEPTAGLDVKRAGLVLGVLRAWERLAFLVVSSHHVEGFDFIQRRVEIRDGNLLE